MIPPKSNSIGIMDVFFKDPPFQNPYPENIWIIFHQTNLEKCGYEG